MRDVLMRLLEPPVEALGYELVDIECAEAGRGGILRLFIDRPVADAPGCITVDDCAVVSHAVSELLEREDPIKGHYTLEVSSPGFDRILRKREHFARFVGARIAAQLKPGIAGQRRFVGVLKAMTEDSIVVDVDGQEHRLPLERIQKARLRPE